MYITVYALVICNQARGRVGIAVEMTGALTKVLLSVLQDTKDRLHLRQNVSTKIKTCLQMSRIMGKPTQHGKTNNLHRRKQRRRSASQ